jgi:cell wall-associated NlpC family hydrolase
VTSVTVPAHSAQAPHAPALAARRARRALAIAVGVADVRRAPDASSELVTQALLGASAVPLESSDSGWTRIRLVDYEGWARDEQLAAPTRKAERVAVVAATHTPLYTASRGAASEGEVFVTSLLPITATGQRPSSERVRVSLPGGRVAWVAADAVEQRPADDPYPLRGAATAVALAKRLLDVPYLWGGVSQRGIDCSGLAQLACRAGGAIIPRDADQQYEGMPFVVDRASVRLGDLVFFADKGAITHVGIALDNMALLHASGSGEHVIITSLDPAEGGYGARLAGMYAGARRAFTEQSADR